MDEKRIAFFSYQEFKEAVLKLRKDCIIWWSIGRSNLSRAVSSCLCKDGVCS
jgi:hypothetical protein